MFANPLLGRKPALGLIKPAVVGDVVDGQGRYYVGRICKALGLGAAALARVTARSTESTAQYFRAGTTFVKLRNEDTQKMVQQLIEILALLRAMGYADYADRWMAVPLPEFEGKTPADILREGRGRELIAHLVALASGNIGS